MVVTERSTHLLLALAQLRCTAGIPGHPANHSCHHGNMGSALSPRGDGVIVPKQGCGGSQSAIDDLLWLAQNEAYKTTKHSRNSHKGIPGHPGEDSVLS